MFYVYYPPVLLVVLLVSYCGVQYTHSSCMSCVGVHSVVIKCVPRVLRSHIQFFMLHSTTLRPIFQIVTAKSIILHRRPMCCTYFEFVASAVCHNRCVLSNHHPRQRLARYFLLASKNTCPCNPLLNIAALAIS